MVLRGLGMELVSFTGKVRNPRRHACTVGPRWSLLVLGGRRLVLGGRRWSSEVVSGRNCLFLGRVRAFSSPCLMLVCHLLGDKAIK